MERLGPLAVDLRSGRWQPVLGEDGQRLVEVEKRQLGEAAMGQGPRGLERHAVPALRISPVSELPQGGEAMRPAPGGLSPGIEGLAQDEVGPRLFPSLLRAWKRTPSRT